MDPCSSVRPFGGLPALQRFWGCSSGVLVAGELLKISSLCFASTIAAEANFHDRTAVPVYIAHNVQLYSKYFVPET